MEDFFHFTVMDALGGSEQHEAFSQETKAGFSHVDCFEEVAFFDPNCSIFMNLILSLNGNMTLAEMFQKRVLFGEPNHM